jgi:transcription-repair coupling factor (superfamily II helicase)
MNLIEIASLKSLCSKIGVDYVFMRNNEIHMRFCISADIDLIRVLQATKQYPDKLRMQGGNPPTLIYFSIYKKNPDKARVFTNYTKTLIICIKIISYASFG